MTNITNSILDISNKLYSIESKYVQINYIIWHKKKKYIINYGCSKPLGYSNYYKSIHAEIVAIKKIKNLNINNIIIIIFKLKKEKNVFIIRPYFSCLCCTKTIKKYNLQNLFYTIDNNKLLSCIIENPQISIGLKLKLNK